MRQRAVYLHSPLALVVRLLAQGGSDTGPCQGFVTRQGVVLTYLRSLVPSGGGGKFIQG